MPVGCRIPPSLDGEVDIPYNLVLEREGDLGSGIDET
jgi:hypothetical protein